ncbi:DUF4838 domain-containing protein [Parapedobacter defluvii]|uniref:DUF4838 domain-containing protein n=1 Tax=Parapedobacter defluvii TaxID=2045106 RepID=UPI0033418523
MPVFHTQAVFRNIRVGQLGKRRSMYILTGFLLLTGTVSVDAQTLLAQQGRSRFRVIIPDDAPASVRVAAQEFLRMFRESTGVQLPLVQDRAVANPPFISLGNTQQAHAAGVLTDTLPDDGFRILLRNHNLYIAGNDTDDGQTTAGGGESAGTANGVYTFLEDYLKARWLMPGELGRTVAVKEILSLPDIDRTEAPLFVYRKLPYLNSSRTMVNSSADVLAWQQRHKLGFSVNLWHSHNWEQTVPRSLYKQHPEWFPMIGASRPEPGFRYKLETTNPDLVDFFAACAVAELKKNKVPRTYSLSPSDSKGWSESPESKALYDLPRPGERYPGMSSLVLRFYHDVAEIVARRYPEGKLAGYLYDDYLYPPMKTEVRFPSNFIPVIAPSSITYGFRLYHEPNKKDWEYVMSSWAKVAPPVWIYYDIPNAFNLWKMTADYDRLSGAVGIVTPPGAELLNFIFRGMVKHGIRGAYLFGTPAWSNTALANYIMAKMLWDPRLDAYEVQRDWLCNAYGDEAGLAMEQFYLKLEDIYRHYSKDRVITSRPNDALFGELYGPHYAGLECLFLQAWKKPMTDVQQARLNLIRDNLAVLQWRLRNAGFLPDTFSTPLSRTTAQIDTLLRETTDAFHEFPEALLGWKQREVEQLKDIRFRMTDRTLATAGNAVELPLQNKNLVVLHAEEDREITLHTRRVTHGTLFASCIIRTSTGEEVYTGLLDKKTPVTFRAVKGTTYYLYFPARPGTSFEMDITGTLAVTQLFRHQLLTSRHADPVYICLPYQQNDAIITAQQLAGGKVRILKDNRLAVAGPVDPQD